jgi:uncharacterized protein YndB with AHSA1/START domain
MEGKVKIQFEYVINCSPRVLYNRLSSASGLAEWFADDVRVQGNNFTFFWEGSEQTAEIVLRKENKMVRFHWIDEDSSFFEFRITQDELTGDVSLIVVDYVGDDEQQETKELWDTQIADLKHILGS